MTIAIPRQYSARVTHTEKVSPKVFWIKAEAAEDIEYQAGQYASWLIGQARRPLSYATPAQGRELEFLVDISPNGIASQFVANLKNDDTFNFLSPYGRFVVDPGEATSRIFVAAGTGLAPIRAQLYDLLPHTTIPTTLIFGNRSPDYMFLMEELTNLAQSYRDTLSFIPTSEEQDPAWAGEVGQVTDVLKKIIPHNLTAEFYLCGSPAMVYACKALLDEQQVRKEHIHTEQFT